MTFRRAIKLAVLLLLGGAVAALFFSPLRHQLTMANARGWVLREQDVVEHLWYAPLLFILAYAVGCIFAVPASIFIAVAGALWGWKFGALYAMCGGMSGAIASYFVGRFLGEGLLDRFGKAGAAVKAQVEKAGLKTMLIVRLIPGPPFAVWNYGAGVARVRFLDYALGTFLGTLPAHLVFAYSADALFNGTLSEGDAVKRLVLVMVLLLAIVLVPTLVKKRMESRAEAELK